MSEIVHIFGDLAGLRPALPAWRASKVDKKAVGKLTKFLGPLQEPCTVDDALSFVPMVAGPAGRVQVDEAAGTVSVRVVVTDHQLHDLAAPLIGAFRLAGARGAKGSLWLVEGATDAPGFGHRLEVDDTAATVQALKKAELRAIAGHPARAELSELEEALGNQPPTTDDDLTRAMNEVPLQQRPAYRAVWDFLAATDESALRDAVARASDWVHPATHLDSDLLRLRDAPDKAAFLEVLGAFIPGTHRGRLDLMFNLVGWVDPVRGAELIAAARAAGTWPPFLCEAMRALLASQQPTAVAEAWALFEAACEDKQCDLNLWYYRSNGPYAIAQSPIPTSELIARLDKALLKKTQAANQKRAEGYCLALAWRSEPEAQAAITRTVASVPERLKSCIEHYARQNGWVPA